jgi:hypothetical protein
MAAIVAGLGLDDPQRDALRSSASRQTTGLQLLTE